MTNVQWITVLYQANSLFTLKPASATSSGGKTLLCPTPFALKMALLDAALRLYGTEQGAILFPSIRNLQIAIQLPEQAVVNNTFIKILRPHKSGPKDMTGTGLIGPMGNTIAFREYVSFVGPMCLAFRGMDLEELTSLLLQVNYLGKRGGFIQLQEAPIIQNWSEDELMTQGYVLLTKSMDTAETYSLNGLLQVLDDCGPKMTFDHANIYSGKRIRLGNERILRHVVLPYRLARSSKGYSYYVKSD